MVGIRGYIERGSCLWPVWSGSFERILPISDMDSSLSVGASSKSEGSE